MKVPFFHNNDDYDEVLFYHAGDFFSRDNIHPGMITLHPGGFTHGPHPKALKNVLQQSKPATNEYAVMIDTRDALEIAPAAAQVEWQGYVDSWKGAMKPRETRDAQARRPRRTPGHRQSRHDALPARARHRADAAGGARRLGGRRAPGSPSAPRRSSAVPRPSDVMPFDAAQCAAPLPRAYHWVDGSAYVNHVELVRKARGAEMPASFWTDPLVYQGGSDDLLGPRDDVPFGDTAWGIDLEAEVAVITDDVPMATTAADAAGAHQAHHAGQRLVAARAHSRRARQGLRLLPIQARHRVLSRGGDAGRAR